MAEEKKEPIVLTQCHAPVPQPKRGYGYAVSSFSADDGDFFCYTNTTNVIVRNLADPNQAILFGQHKEKVNCGAFSHSGEFIASADKDGQLLIWARKTKVVKYTYKCVKEAYDIQWSLDDDYILVVGIGTGTENACLLSVKTGKPVASVIGHSKPVLSASFGKDTIISSSEDMSLRFLSGDQFSVTSSNKKVHKAYINCVKFSPNKELIASVASDKKLVIWSADFTVVKEIKDAHKGSIYSVSWSPCNKYVLTASADKTAKIWDIETGKSTKTFSWNSKDVNNMQMSALWHGGKDQQFLVTVSLDGTLNYLDQESGEIKSIMGVSFTPSAVTVDPHNKNFYVGDVKGNILAHSNDEGWQKISGRGPKKRYKSLATNCNSELVWALSGNTVYTIECKEMKYTGSISLPAAGTTLTASRKDPSIVAVGLVNKNVGIIKDGTLIATNSTGSVVPQVIEFSPDDDRIAIAAKTKRKIITYNFDASTNKISDPTTIYDKLDGQPTRIQFGTREDLNANYISCSTMRGEIIVTKDGTLANKNKWSYHCGGVLSHSWNPSGKLVSSVSQDQCLFVWYDTEKFRKRIHKMQNVHMKGGVFTDWIDETNVLSVGISGAVKMWEVTIDD